MTGLYGSPQPTSDDELDSTKSLPRPLLVIYLFFFLVSLYKLISKTFAIIGCAGSSLWRVMLKKKKELCKEINRNCT